MIRRDNGLTAEAYRPMTDLHPDDTELQKRIGDALRSNLSPRHVPDRITAVADLPRTLNGKKLEVPVRKILLGTPIEKAANPDAMANPEVLSHFTPADLL